MLAITLGLAGIFTPKLGSIRDAGAGSVGAIYAADSALEWCLYTNRGNGSVSAPVMSNGATYSITRAGVVSGCGTSPLNEQIVGTYNGVSRSLYVSTPQ